MSKQIDLNLKHVQDALAYIDDYWPQLERFHPNDDSTLVGLPKPYLVPAHKEGDAFSFNEMYYWDSYFMVQSMLNEEHKELVAGILENLLSMVGRFGVIPNASRTYFTGHSQPPMLTSLVLEVYRLMKYDPEWLERSMNIAKEEYRKVWMSTEHPHWRQVYRGLSRYYDVNVLHDLAEAESGWDMTPRFSRKCLHYLPVDLNALLYKYEVDFAAAAEILSNNEEAQNWRIRAETRKETMNALMWDRLRGFYFDYDWKREKRGSVWSLAAYFPMWAGMVSSEQAAKLVKNLSKFEHRGGLATTNMPQFLPGKIKVQWAYPNGWSPLHFIVVEALKRYGYHAEAERIARKWVRTNTDWFVAHGEFLEKYNVVQPGKEPVEGVYPSQTGFGWTNAVYERFVNDFLVEIDTDSKPAKEQSALLGLSTK